MVNIEQIEAAAKLIRPHTIKTPLIYAPSLSRMFEAEIYLKLENLQRTGSFKVRGASYKLLKGTAAKQISAAGVVAASAGNHAQGVAWAAQMVGLPATIVMPLWASISKQEATRGFGADVILHGNTLEESLAHAETLSAKGLTFIHPFDDQQIITGQATAGLEIVKQLPQVDQILVPIGGGGLIAGICLAVKNLKPAARIIGVESATCPSARASMDAGRPTRVSSSQSIADGINVKQVGDQPFAVLKSHLENVVLVSEEHVAAAILMLMERKKILAEGAGAAPLAALLSGAARIKRKRKVVLVISGGNLDSPLLGRILNKGLVKNGRLTRFRVRLQDQPGSLARLLALIAAKEANVLHILHDRNREDAPLYIASVDLELETRSKAHIEEIRAALERSDFPVETLSECLD